MILKNSDINAVYYTINCGGQNFYNENVAIKEFCRGVSYYCYHLFMQEVLNVLDNNEMGRYSSSAYSHVYRL